MKLPLEIEELRIKPDYPNLIAALEECEFKSRCQEVRDEAAQMAASQQSEFGLQVRNGGCPQPQILALPIGHVPYSQFSPLFRK